MGFADFFKPKQAAPEPAPAAPAAPLPPASATRQSSGPSTGPRLPWETASPTPAQEDAGAGPKIDLAKRAPGLVNLSKQAGISLEKKGLSGVRAAVYLVLDHSGSMASYYRSGVVQDFTEKVLAAAVHFDDDGSIPISFFDTVAHPITEVTVDNYQGAVQRIKDGLGRMGTTDYAVAMRAVIQHYKASGSTEPALVIFQTDGSPDSRTKAEQAICEAASLPIFWQFVGFGQDRFEFLKKLDDLAVPKKRVIDNAGFFEAGADPRSMPAQTLYDNLMGEFPTWLRAARQQGIVRS